MKSLLSKVILATSCLILAFAIHVGRAEASGNIVVVVAKKSPITKLTHAQVKSLYLGETKFVAPGQSVELRDRDRTSEIFKEFYAGLVSMTPKQVTVHWSRKVFTGEAPPPTRDMGEDASVIEALKSKPEAINYIYEKNVNRDVRVVYSLKDR